MKTAKKVAMTIALGLSMIVSTGCASEEEIRTQVVEEVTEANNQIFKEQEEELIKLREKNKELNELAYMNGEKVKWLQKAYDELLEKYNAIKPKEVAQKVNTIEGVKGTPHTFQCTWYNEFGGSTAIGTSPRPWVCAVDPRVIPLRSKVYVEVPAAPEYSGWYSCEDTGGGIKGNILDLHVLNDGHIPSVGRTKCIVYY